ncbi:MAG: peptidyl-prolyl cis-trans isomerase, partial [Spartobacteria bacterium]|nr:peptidyl-prolyl cis-trans isomerase [Spartobacteria bacterium]
RGLTERMDVQHNLQNLRRQALARALRDDIYRNTPAPTEEEIQATYDDNPERWVQPEAYLLDVLQYDPADTGTAVSAEELALQKIVEDDQLETLKGQWLATQVTGPWIASNQVDAVIWTDLAGLQDGQAMVFDNERATLFIRRGAHRMETVLPLEEVRADIRNALLSARQEEAWQSFVENEQKKLGFAPLPEQKEDEDEQANDQEEDIIDEQ